MANGLSTIEPELVNKDKAAVETRLGAPVLRRRWKNPAPPEGADAAALSAFEDVQPDEIWIYTNGRVHFNLTGLVIKVDDAVSRDLPPEEGRRLFV